jgi:cell division protein FtsQ
MSATLPLAPAGIDDPVPPGPGSPGGRHRGLIVLAIVTVLLALLAVWLVAFSSVLGVRTVTVRGAHHVTADRVRAAAAISAGAPLMRLDTAAVERRVEALPGVARATVRTDYPSSVIVTVTERTAVGYLSSGRDYVLVDHTGDQYRTVKLKPHTLPLFSVPRGAEGKATGRAAAAVAGALTRDLLAKVGSVQALDPTSVTLLLHDGRVVRWGSPARSADKVRILPILLHQPGTQFDLTNPDQVVAR